MNQTNLKTRTTFRVDLQENLLMMKWSHISLCNTIIVKRVSWFKSSLLLRINIQHTHELQFLIKTKSSIFNWKVYTTDERIGPSVAWLEKIETGSI